jgi:hypothetical protein
LKGLKGAHQAGYSAIWIYESQEAWEMLWGPLECPVQPPEYPEKWKIWENEILAPFLTQHPDGTVNLARLAALAPTDRDE